MAIPYNNNIPLANNIISASQADILNNFASLDQQFNVNHLPFTTTSPQFGYHTLINFQSNVSDPNLIAPLASFYPKLVSGVLELFYQNNNTSGDVVQMTNLPITTVANGGTAGGNISFIDTPWDLRIYTGLTNTLTNGDFTVVFPTAFTTILCAQATPSNKTTIAPGILAATTELTISTTNAATTINWFAFGRL